MKLMPSRRTFTAYVEKDPGTGLYVGFVPSLPGAHTQAVTLEELLENLREVVLLVLESTGSPEGPEPEFVGIHRIEVTV
jgi:predicted RNase H-like HicB family nuclease